MMLNFDAASLSYEVEGLRKLLESALKMSDEELTKTFTPNAQLHDVLMRVNDYVNQIAPPIDDPEDPHDK